MVTQRKNESTFAGFLNGYIAGNLSANSKELQFHKEKINSFLEELERETQKWDLAADQTKAFEELFNGIRLLPFDNTVDFYFKLGDILLSIYSLITETKTEIPSSTNFILKKIIYHYLNIATTLKDVKVTKKAREVVVKFEN